jgi:hypothetical protein
MVDAAVAEGDTTADFMVEAGEAIMADIIVVIAEDSIEDPVIMAELLSASARHTISPLGAGTTLDITRNTTTTYLRQSMINPLLLRHLPLKTLSLHQLLKVLVPVMFYLLHLRPARFHQIFIREDVKFGRRPGSFTMNRAGIHRSK